MFCSTKCADSPIHKYECDISEDNFEKALLQRMFYQAVSICGSLKELESLMQQHNVSKTIMDFDFSEANDESCLKNRILATMSLAEREPWSTEAYAKYETVTKQLKAETEDEREILKNYLVHCLKSMTVNFFHFFWSCDGSDGKGFVLCSLAAYFAHSCDPNCDKIDVDNKFAFIARKPIKADETLSICYDRYDFLTHTLEQRQEYFNRVYTFTCNCMACNCNFPSLDKLPKCDENFVEANVNFKSLREAREQYKKNCEYIQENIENYPSFEICTLMNQNNRLLHKMGNDLLSLN
jgi:SET domain